MNRLSRNYTSIANRTHKVKASKSTRAHRSWAWNPNHAKPGRVKRIKTLT